ncbi:sirohydrochlorin chelatase [Bacillus solimangrovi]|uniref:Sirohydrochlorin ferrochelatase n=1 Tax=Bacillus solimangrovi TaxID=1305675 RepID=A0A1E5LF86_9BACI|nr:sirohydrochlorin chelatase [Bacillus solimangrovi]OEH92741.1 hypothetical protein BFG57_01700 [Bacillus solimangrovi]
MQAVLYICHGSRIKRSNEQAFNLLNQLKVRVSAPIQEVCFLELASPNIEQGLQRCVEKGATSVVIIPFLLLSATHAKVDIPTEVRNSVIKYPYLQIIYGKPLGVHEKMLRVVKERIEEKGYHKPQKTRVLFVGRGSSDPLQIQTFRTIAENLKQQYSYKSVDVAFLVGADPSLSDGLTLFSQEDSYDKIVVPYLLFAGKLLENIQGEANKFQLSVCDPLGEHWLLGDVLQQRIIEAIKEGVCI